MPEIKFKSVSSCSSEDQRNPAQNLLKDGGSYKWKSETAGEKSVFVILQFSEASQIHSIDIGNEGSAFVEVLVGKEFDANFEVLLVASSFMTPLESRNGTNRNGVRMFGADKLNKTVANKKWDRVKVVCTQPFCKTSQYGLSFFKLHSPPTGKEAQSKVHKLGHFTIKDDNDDDSDIAVGSLFANRSKDPTPQTSVPSGAAAIRAAARQAVTSPASTSSPLPKEESRKRSAVSPPRASPGPKAARGDAIGTDEEDPPPVPKPGLKKQSTSITSTASSSSTTPKADKSALKRTKTAPATGSKAFSKLMEDVTFVLSGFQNPFRGELRDKACEMGAKYRSDWARGCTHLICAFANTPKYKQVAGKGKIVTKSWVTDSHKQKKLLPWRKYRLGDADSPSEDSESEEELVSSAKKPRPTPGRSSKPQQQAKPEGPRKTVAFNDDSDSGGDTEDELLKARGLSEKKNAANEKTAPQSSKQPDDPYGDSTDEDDTAPSTSSKPSTNSEVKGEGSGSDSGFPDLPEFFKDKHFFFYGDFPSTEQRLLTRYIYAYNGEVEDYMSKRVKYVVTAQKWDDNFDEALNENPDLVFVKPKWIYTCHDKLKLVPYQPHIVV